MSPTREDFAAEQKRLVAELLREHDELGNSYRVWSIDRMRIRGDTPDGLRWHGTVVRDYDDNLDLAWTGRLWQMGPKASDVKLLVRERRPDPVGALNAINAQLRERGWL